MKPIKALQLFNQYLPQTENWAYQLIRNSPNVEVYIGARRFLSNPFYDPSFTFARHPFGGLEARYEELSNRSIKELFQKGMIRLLRPLLGSVEQEMIRFGREQQVDLVHAHFADVAWYFRSVPRQLKVPWVISFYGWDYEQLPFLKKEYREYYQQLFQSADAFICEGAHGAGILKKMGCRPEKIHIVRLGVEVERIPFFHRSKASGTLKLIQIAAFTEKKGQLYTVKAFAEARKYCPDLRLCLVGSARSANYFEQVRRLTRQLSVEEEVEFLEGVDYTKLYDFMQDYHVFIHPSCYAADLDCEGGAPVVLLDAQATGMPVISTRHCDIPGEVIEGETGMLCEEKESGELATLIRRFYEMDNAEYQEYCRRARRHIEENFDISTNASALRKVYFGLFGSGKS